MDTDRRRTSIVAAALAVGTIVTLAVVAVSLRGDAAAEVDEGHVLDRTIVIFEQKYDDDPYNYLIAARLADRYRLRFQSEADLADLERARELALDVLAHSSDSASSYARLALLDLSRHDFGSAYESARKAVAADGDDEGALGALFDAAEAVGRTAVAESALARMPRSSAARDLRAARWKASNGELRSAMRTQREVCGAFAAGPSGPRVVAWCLTQLAGLELEIWGPEAARDRFEEALDVFPGDRGALEGLADLAYAERRWERAEELYRRILADAHPDLYLRMSEVLAAQGEETEAARFEERFLRVATVEDHEPLFARPLALYFARRPATRGDRALQLARRDVERRPTAESYEVLAWIHFRRGELERALALSDRAREGIDPGPNSDYHRARILRALDREGEAGELLARVRAAEPALLSHHVLRAMRLEG